MITFSRFDDNRYYNDGFRRAYEIVDTQRLLARASGYCGFNLNETIIP